VVDVLDKVEPRMVRLPTERVYWKSRSTSSLASDLVRFGRWGPRSRPHRWDLL